MWVPTVFGIDAVWFPVIIKPKLPPSDSKIVYCSLYVFAAIVTLGWSICVYAPSVLITA